MATTRLVVDPITRIEGHLRIEVQAEDGRISNAWASATQFRGLELVLKGRDPRDAWAFAQRICGVCTVVHAVASLRAVEDALDIKVPAQAELIRNMMLGMQYIHDHVVHFYHLHALDWVDVVSALKADPVAAEKIAKTMSDWPSNNAVRFKEVQDRVAGFVQSGQLGIFTNGYWGHPAYKLPPEVNLIAVSHYLEALDWQRDVVQLHAIFGGKNPHPNFIVGGMASPINLEARSTINADRLTEVDALIKKAQAFVEKVYWPDLVAIAGFYKDWAAIGGGTGNYLCYGDLPKTPGGTDFYFPRGVVMNKDLSKVVPFDQAGVTEQIHSAWYEYSGGNDAALHPWDGETKAAYTGPKAPWTYLQDEKKYTWMKAPRYNGKPMEVGPLARMLVGYASGQPDIKAIVDATLKALNVGPEALFSTLGRTAARGMESLLYAKLMRGWFTDFVGRIKGGDTSTHNGEKWEPSTWPKEAKGWGFMEAPRGALGHWVNIKDGKIENYQAVVPSTWNCSPRDKDGVMGPYEAALVDNHPLFDPERPIEILRTIHSFDPCLACGVHVLDATGREITQVKVQ
jgi:[NiFe] hydrogenase large subunit/hydrogenase large subunit